MQSPRNFFAALSPTDPLSIDALVRQMAEDAPELPGVMGEAATSALFAGYWTERLGIPARPVEGQRVYRLESVARPTEVAGRLRRATVADRDLLVPWSVDFMTVGDMPLDPVETLDRHLANERLWLWEDNSAVSMVYASAPIAGVSRIGFVYTPPGQRRRGYASALVAAVSEELLANGAQSCMLYAQLHNPTSNSIYRRIGYRAVSEVLHYRFG